MRRRIKSNLLAILLFITYLIFKIIAKNCPDEFVFVFFSTVFPQYVKWGMYLYDLSEQFRLVWPWRR